MGGRRETVDGRRKTPARMIRLRRIGRGSRMSEDRRSEMEVVIASVARQSRELRRLLHFIRNDIFDNSNRLINEKRKTNQLLAESGWKLGDEKRLTDDG